MVPRKLVSQLIWSWITSLWLLDTYHHLIQPRWWYNSERTSLLGSMTHPKLKVTQTIIHHCLNTRSRLNRFLAGCLAEYKKRVDKTAFGIEGLNPLGVGKDHIFHMYLHRSRICFSISFDSFSKYNPWQSIKKILVEYDHLLDDLSWNLEKEIQLPWTKINFLITLPRIELTLSIQVKMVTDIVGDYIHVKGIFSSAQFALSPRFSIRLSTGECLNIFDIHQRVFFWTIFGLASNV